jgi:GTP-binding protein
VQGSTNVSGFASLSSHHEYSAEDGANGLEKNKFGGNGQDLVLYVPLTTEVIVNGELKLRIDKNGQKEKLFTGGRGTFGNLTIKKHPFRKRIAEEDRLGERADVTLILKLTADVIFVGYPNAGKSSLLNHLTNANAKTAPYEFTTLEPQTGYMDDIKLMDLPGLIGGTHLGKGLGTDFVQHTENTKMLAHVVSLEHEHPIEKYQALRAEIKLISQALFEKPEIIVLSKTDEVTQEKIAESIKSFEALGLSVVSCSILDDQSILKTKAFLQKCLTSLYA